MDIKSLVNELNMNNLIEDINKSFSDKNIIYSDDIENLENILNDIPDKEGITGNAVVFLSAYKEIETQKRPDFVIKNIDPFKKDYSLKAFSNQYLDKTAQENSYDIHYLSDDILTFAVFTKDAIKGESKIDVSSKKSKGKINQDWKELPVLPAPPKEKPPENINILPTIPLPEQDLSDIEVPF